MKKNHLLIIILAITIVAIILVLVLTHQVRYESLVLNESKWNEIISSRSISSNISLDSINFNDYGLMIDKDSSIYYSVVEGKRKYNPLVSYKTNIGLRIAFNKNLSDDNNILVMIYNDKYYRTYSLKVVNEPILSIYYKDKNIVELTLFDNHVDSPNRLTKTDAKIMHKNDEYHLSLIMESLGRNRRKNNIPILGMDKNNEYVLRKDNSEKSVLLFIDGKYEGKYSLT